jgi:NitT/TauT family transport system ATP-binding protein
MVAALAGVDLDVPAGQLLVLIGPSGQGKSTLLNGIAGLIRPTQGEIRAHGELVTGPSRERGVVFQQDTTFPWMRVRDHIAYGLHGQGISKTDRDSIVDRYLTAVGLADFGRSWPKELSGGMRKRLSIATAFATNPGILLMDEPFGSLDFITRANLHTTLLELWQETGKTVLFVTHDVDEALLLADRICVLAGGLIVDDIEVAFERPRGDDLRADPDAIELRRLLLDRLGLRSTVLA